MSNTESLTEAEKDACICLSTLFLDCGDQLDHILCYEVFPILYPNLLNPAGTWDYFDEADLITRINGLRTQPKVLQMLGSNMAWMTLAGSVLTSWAPVKEILRQLDQAHLRNPPLPW
ncbi:hypothetical protein COH21_010494 [Aspergillus flavus]|nr:hypothetical protein COH21_010494 [Aspergillus flavus]